MLTIVNAKIVMTPFELNIPFIQSPNYASNAAIHHNHNFHASIQPFMEYTR